MFEFFSENDDVTMGYVVMAFLKKNSLFFLSLKRPDEVSENDTRTLSQIAPETTASSQKISFSISNKMTAMLLTKRQFFIPTTH